MLGRHLLDSEDIVVDEVTIPQSTDRRSRFCFFRSGTVLDLPGEHWLWDKRPECPAPLFAYRVPETLPREVAAVVSISNRAVHPSSPSVVEFWALEPNRSIIRTESHVQAFRRDFSAFLMQLVRAGVRVLHPRALPGPVTPRWL